MTNFKPGDKAQVTINVGASKGKQCWAEKTSEHLWSVWVNGAQLCYGENELIIKEEPMATFKPGDRVHVEFDAVIKEPRSGWFPDDRDYDDVVIQAADQNLPYNTLIQAVGHRFMTLIAPAEPPRNSVVAVVGRGTNRTFANIGENNTSPWISDIGVAHTWDAVVTFAAGREIKVVK